MYHKSTLKKLNTASCSNVDKEFERGGILDLERKRDRSGGFTPVILIKLGVILQVFKQFYSTVGFSKHGVL